MNMDAKLPADAAAAAAAAVAMAAAQVQAHDVASTGATVVAAPTTPAEAAAAAAAASLMVESVGMDVGGDARHGAKRSVGEMDAGDEYDEDDDDDGGEFGAGKDDLKDKRNANKRTRRHHWQAKYEMEFGLLAIERDGVSGDVTLAMCGFCKAFGREGKYEQLLQADAETGNDTKKRRRRSLTTTKFFRAFRVDNIRSHLQGAHPRRWAEYEMLPKQEAVRSRYLQMHGEFQYDGLPIDDVVLGGSALHTESEMAYAQAQAQALGATLAEAQHTPAAAANGASPAATYATAVTTTTPTMAYGNKIAGSRRDFDYEKHLVEQLALDRERLDFEKAKFKKEVELRERELAQREKMMEQEQALHEKRMAANEADQGKFTARLAEVVREVLSGGTASGVGGSVV